ncbi:hypothetical protein [Streptomyces sp. BBFR102]|uniref:hypothetical protein n=1 Tax=Streptomyces sp. BBFR102 TaxID=3448171 RepID=UPI003F53547B
MRLWSVAIAPRSFFVMDGHDERGKPSIGDLAKDTTTDRVGVLMGEVAGRYLMRPPAGGCEWEVKPEHIEAPTAREELSARNGVRNRMARLGL